MRKEELHDGNIANGQAWAINLRRPQFQDARVREAIGLAFNFEWSNATLFYGLYERVKSFWDNSELAATGLPDAAELALLEPLRAELPGTVFTEPAALPRSAASGSATAATCAAPPRCWTRPAGPSPRAAATGCAATTRGIRCGCRSSTIPRPSTG